MEFRFVPRTLSKILAYHQDVAIQSQSGQYLTASQLGLTPVLTLSGRPSYEWVILGAPAGNPVLVDAPVALGNAVVRQDVLSYCPGTPGLELSWARVCPPAPSAPGEQPAGVVSPRPLPSVPPTPGK